MSNWSITAEPEGKNTSGADELNEGGLILYLSSNGSRQEVSRVAFVRRNSRNPSVSFDKQLAAEIEKARAARDLLNSSVAGVLA